MTDTRATLKSIQEAAEGTDPVPRELLREWMAHEDLAVQGVCWEALLTSEEVQPRVTPPLTVDEVLDFGFRYFSRLLKESDNHLEYAALQIVNWFERNGDYSVWYNPAPPPPVPKHPGPCAASEALEEWNAGFERFLEPAQFYEDVRDKLAAWLTEVYLGADEGLQAFISRAVLHPLFTRSYWFWQLYPAWAGRPLLGPALLAACDDGFFESECSTPREIMAACCLPGPIPMSTLRVWLDDPNLGLAGSAVCDILAKEAMRARLEPQPGSDEVHDLYLAYYERCVKENPVIEGDTEPRWDAMQEILHWYVHPPEANDIPFLTRARDWLARLYVEGDEDTHDAIVCGAVEHILEQPRWRELFAPWLDDPALAEAYRSAAQWYQHWEEERGCSQPDGPTPAE